VDYKIDPLYAYVKHTDPANKAWLKRHKRSRNHLLLIWAGTRVIIIFLIWIWGIVPLVFSLPIYSYIYIYIYIYIRKYINKYISIYIYIHIYTYIYMHIYIYKYIQKYKNIYKSMFIYTSLPSYSYSVDWRVLFLPS
jgi:hypothetical protein